MSVLSDRHDTHAHKQKETHTQTEHMHKNTCTHVDTHAPHITVKVLLYVKNSWYQDKEHTV